MDRDQLIAKMRGRIEMCRRLAKSTLDKNVAVTLNQMADEGEADIARLLAEDGAGPGMPPNPQAG
jgi:hypothetical protein